MSETTEITDREQNLSRVSHISRNVHGATKLLCSLPLTTRLKMLETSERAGVSQQHIVQQGTLAWCGIINHALDLGLSMSEVYEAFKTCLEAKAQAKPVPKSTKTGRQAEPKPPKGVEAVMPEPVNPKPRRGTKTAK